MFYTGIGSRSTPLEVQAIMGRIAKYLKACGYVLRSGGASGADKAFEVHAGELKEVYLPWEGFNSSSSPYHSPSDEAYVLAEKYHPAWHRLKPSVKALMARNMHQVLGLSLDSPSRFAVCYTQDGYDSGGTGQALRLCRDLNIPVFNLFFPENKQKLWLFLSK